MAKGDDALMRKKNKARRKRMRSDENADSARIATIIASKRRRKAGKRRMCEGMCFSLPTPEDPFNDRYNNKNSKNTEEKPKNNNNNKKNNVPIEKKNRVGGGSGGSVEDVEEVCLSKFLILCLNAIQNASKKEEEEEEAKEGVEGSFIASSWVADFWRHCLAGWNILDMTGACANKEQLAWLVSTASDLITRKEKQGALVSSPFLLFLVPSQEKAVEVRSMCKPLKALGVHTVSLHPGASIDHQIHGLKSCEPEFLISTPERLVELLSLRAIDISGVSLLVLDGLKSFMDLGFSDKLQSIRENIAGQYQVVIFSDCDEEPSASLKRSLLQGRVYKLSMNNFSASQSELVSRNAQAVGAEEGKLPKVRGIRKFQ